MTGQREVGFCENCVNVLTGELDLNQIIHREEKKAEAENSADNNKKETINYSFSSYL